MIDILYNAITDQSTSFAIIKEPFDLAVWIAENLGLNTDKERYKQRLNELIDAFDKAGYKTKEVMVSIDDAAIIDIDEKLPEESKLEWKILRGIYYYFRTIK